MNIESKELIAGARRLLVLLAPTQNEPERRLIRNYEKSVLGGESLEDILASYKELLHARTKIALYYVAIIALSIGLAGFVFLKVRAHCDPNEQLFCALIAVCVVAIAEAKIVRSLRGSLLSARVSIERRESQLKGFCGSVQDLMIDKESPLSIEDFSSRAVSEGLIYWAKMIIEQERLAQDEKAKFGGVDIEAMVRIRIKEQACRAESYRLRRAAESFGISHMTKKEYFAIAEARLDADKRHGPGEPSADA